MSGDTSPLSEHWARKRVVDRRTSAETMAMAEQLTDELDRVESGELSAKLVLCRYSARQLLAVSVYWGLLSDESKRLELMQAWARTA